MGIQCSIALWMGGLGSVPDFDYFYGKLLPWFLLVSAVSVLHGCILSFCILILALSPQSLGGALVAGQRHSVALSLWMHFTEHH